MASGPAIHDGSPPNPAALGLLDRSSFWSPDFLAESAWLAHAPFMFWLIGAHRPGVFVELGTHTGFSFFAACQAVERHATGTRTYAVDTWLGDEHSGAYGDEVFVQVYRHAERNYSAFASLLRGTFDESLPYFDDGSIDVLHIDGRHFYDDVRHDLEAWLPKMSARGVVLLHDTNVRERGFGVSRLLDETRLRYRHFEFVHGHGLGVLGVGGTSSDGIDALLAIEPGSQMETAVRAMYARLGEAVEYAWRREVAERRADTTEQLLAERARVPGRERGPQGFTADRTAGDVTEEDVVVATGSPLFDQAWYLEHYPDIADAGSDPVRHYLQYGAQEGRDPGPQFSTAGYLGRYPDVAQAAVNPLLHYLRCGAAEDRLTGPLVTAHVPVADGTRSWEAISQRYPDLTPMRIFRSAPAVNRVSVVLDSIDAGSPVGSAGTAIVVAAMLAQHRDAVLRIVTRHEPADRSLVPKVLRIHGVETPAGIEFEFADTSSRNYVAIGPDELFLTTSWWTTRSMLQTVRPEQLVYLLQEDERLSYPIGDEHLRCAETLALPGIRFLANSKALFDHLVDEGFTNIADAGRYFEPAFPESLFRPHDRPADGRMDLLFHARPDRPRDLYYRGLEALDLAIETGALDPQDWTFTFLGGDQTPVTLSGGIRPTIAANLPWDEYGRVLGSVDLGISLTYTHGPGYLPLGIIASGAVAVTNRSGDRTDLGQYSANLICVDVDPPSLAAGIGHGARLAADSTLRRTQYEASHLLRSWNDALEAALSGRFLD